MTHIEWETFLPVDVNAKSKEEDKYFALFSLLDHLDIPLTGFLIWLFSSKHGAVRQKVGKFLSYHANYAVPFAPKVIWDLWHQSPHVVRHLHHEIVTPCAHEIAVAESDTLLADSSLHISVAKCSLKSLEEALNPFGLVRKFQELSPFMFGILMTSMAAPNKYQKRKATRLAKNVGSSAQSQEQTRDECDDDPDVPEFTQTFIDFAEWEPEFTFFDVKCLVPIVFIISILLFNRNSRANVLALPVGLFLRIGGANKRMISVLNSIGICISYWTIERLKQALSDDAIHLAQNLMCSTKSWFVVFDNINIYLRKFEQQLTNKNSMLSLTNVAIIAQPDFPPDALELEPFLKLRGNRSNGTAADIKITCEESRHMEQAMTAIVAGLLVAYCPGSTEWPEYDRMKAQLAALTPTDRPLPVKKTETRPFGIFDINEGSKRGCVQVIHAIAKRSTLTVEQWVKYVRILMGDWLSAANLRGARRERADDVSPFKQLINIKEISALWHYALNALHMIIKTHLGNASDDPGSLASHKGLLGRVWDVNKPDYAAAKSLVRHSLIACILNIVMEMKGYTQYSQLSEWKPEFSEVADISARVVQDFANPVSASAAQEKGDNWLAHSIYFIRDSLIFLVFENYISIADPGGVLQVIKYWVYSFRGAGMWNYSQGCLEVLVLWKYELPQPLKTALEQSWFVNKWGKMGRWIPTDLYLEHMNFWIKRVFIAQGSGVTAEYMAQKGSACVEAFQYITHKLAQFTGTLDISRRHKEAKFHIDVRALANHMQKNKLHTLSSEQRFIPATSKRGAKTTASLECSAITDVMEIGADFLVGAGGFEEFLVQTTFDPALGWPLDGSHSDLSMRTSDHAGFMVDDETTLDTGDDIESLAPGAGALGGGSDFD